MVEEYDLPLLLHLAEKTRLYTMFCTTTIALAKDLKLSQQSISRKLIVLERQGLVKRAVSMRGVDLKLTPAAIVHLREYYHNLKKLFSSKFQLRGTVQDGLGEGKFYMSIPYYKQQFKKHFELTPYPGTLNLKVDPDKAALFLQQKKVREVIIPCFKTVERTFGGVVAYPVRLCDSLMTVLIVPDRTNHTKDIIEVIAGKSIRQHLHLKTGDEVVLQ